MLNKRYNMIHNMTVKQPYFDLIKAGKKTIELRLYDNKRRQIQIGDEIVFQNGDNFHRVSVKGMFLAKNFEELFKYVDPKFAGMNSIKEAIDIMEQFYDKDAQKKFGVVGICIENKKDN